MDGVRVCLLDYEVEIFAFFRKVIFELRRGSGQVVIWGKAFQTDGTASAKSLGGGKGRVLETQRRSLWQNGSE